MSYDFRFTPPTNSELDDLTAFEYECDHNCDDCFWSCEVYPDECLRIIMLRDNWEIRVDKTDLLGEFNGALRIVRADGRITSINPEAIALVCTQRRSQI